MQTTASGEITPPTPDELRAYTQQSFRVYLVLCLTLLSLSYVLRIADIPRPTGVLIGTWFAAFHFFQPTYPGTPLASRASRATYSIGLGSLLGVITHWIVRS